MREVEWGTQGGWSRFFVPRHQRVHNSSPAKTRLFVQEYLFCVIVVVAFFLAPSSSSPTSITTSHHSRAYICLQGPPPETMREIVHVQAGQCGNQVRGEATRASGQGHRAIESNTKFCTFSDFLRWLALKTILGLPSRLVRSASSSCPP